MGVVIPVGFGQASFVFGVTGKTTELVTTLGVGPASLEFAVPAGAASTIRDAWSVAGRPFAAAQINTVYTFKGVRLTVMTATGPVQTQSLVNVVGTLAGDPAPPNCAFLVRKQTARGGRKGRGRMYMPPCFFGESGIDQVGALATVFLAPFDAKLELARAAMVTAGALPFLLHEDGSAPDQITSFATQSLIATQRRRLR